MTIKEALGLEFGKVAKELGGFEKLVEVLDAREGNGIVTTA